MQHLNLFGKKFANLLVPVFMIGVAPLWPLPMPRAIMRVTTPALAQAEDIAPATADKLPQPKDAVHPVKKTLWITVTAYSSTVDQTDGDPFTTASGEQVRDGIIAQNGLPFGTRVRFPDAYGEKIFVVKDRMNERKGFYMADIWMPTREAARQWGVKIVKMEILGS